MEGHLRLLEGWAPLAKQNTRRCAYGQSAMCPCSAVARARGWSPESQEELPSTLRYSGDSEGQEQKQTLSLAPKSWKSLLSSPHSPWTVPMAGPCGSH